MVLLKRTISHDWLDSNTGPNTVQCIDHQMSPSLLPKWTLSLLKLLFSIIAPCWYCTFKHIFTFYAKSGQSVTLYYITLASALAFNFQCIFLSLFVWTALCILVWALTSPSLSLILSQFLLLNQSLILLKLVRVSLDWILYLNLSLGALFRKSSFSASWSKACTFQSISCSLIMSIRPTSIYLFFRVCSSVST